MNLSLWSCSWYWLLQNKGILVVGRFILDWPIHIYVSFYFLPMSRWPRNMCTRAKNVQKHPLYVEMHLYPYWCSWWIQRIFTSACENAPETYTLQCDLRPFILCERRLHRKELQSICTGMQCSCPNRMQFPAPLLCKPRPVIVILSLSSHRSVAGNLPAWQCSTGSQSDCGHLRLGLLPLP